MCRTGAWRGLSQTYPGQSLGKANVLMIRTRESPVNAVPLGSARCSDTWVIEPTCSAFQSVWHGSALIHFPTANFQIKLLRSTLIKHREVQLFESRVECGSITA